MQVDRRTGDDNEEPNVTEIAILELPKTRTMKKSVYYGGIGR